eukprot:4995306-Prymnesium_polylepis.1
MVRIEHETSQGVNGGVLTGTGGGEGKWELGCGVNGVVRVSSRRTDKATRGQLTYGDSGPARSQRPSCRRSMPNDSAPPFLFRKRLHVRDASVTSLTCGPDFVVATGLCGRLRAWRAPPPRAATS